MRTLDRLVTKMKDAEGWPAHKQNAELLEFLCNEIEHLKKRITELEIGNTDE